MKDLIVILSIYLASVFICIRSENSIVNRASLIPIFNSMIATFELGYDLSKLYHRKNT